MSGGGNCGTDRSYGTYGTYHFSFFLGLGPSFLQPTPELQDLLLGADHEETVAGLEVGIAGGEDRALAAALDAAHEDSDFAEAGQFGKGSIHVGASVGDGHAFAGEV